MDPLAQQFAVIGVVVVLIVYIRAKYLGAE